VYIRRITTICKQRWDCNHCSLLRRLSVLCACKRFVSCIALVFLRMHLHACMQCAQCSRETCCFQTHATSGTDSQQVHTGSTLQVGSTALSRRCCWEARSLRGEMSTATLRTASTLASIRRHTRCSHRRRTIFFIRAFLGDPPPPPPLCISALVVRGMCEG
jgi:hypothetical protein